MTSNHVPIVTPLYKENDTVFNRSLVNCLHPLLRSLHWLGQEEHVIAALPYMSGISGVSDFVKTMEALNFECHVFHTTINNLSIHFMPCLFVTKNNEVWVVLKKSNNDFVVFDGHSKQEKIIQNLWVTGEVYYFKPAASTLSDALPGSKIPFLKVMAKPYHWVIAEAVVVTFVLSVLALIIPLFSRAVFDEVIPARSSSILFNFLCAIIVVILVSALLNILISKLLVISGARFSDRVNDAILKRILYLAPSYTEGATINSQVARVKDFDNVREFLIGPIFRLFFELIFVVLATVTIAYLGGMLVLIPITSVILYCLFYFIMKNIVSNVVSLSAKSSTERQDFILEALSNLRALKYCHAEETWFNRYRMMSSAAAIKNFHATELNSTINGVLDLIMAGTGFAIVVFGALGVMSGQLTFGSLLAMMIISWRLVTPLKGIFGSQARIQQFAASVRQINALMVIAPEREPSNLLHKIDNLKGNVVFQRVGFRYPNAADFALSGINFNVKHGEVVAIVGPMGSGKSTIIKLMLGLYYPQVGNILLDGVDIRQYDVMNLRNTLGYVSQANSIFFGTVAQNLFLANPMATQEELTWSARRADILDEILSLPKGFDTPINDQSFVHLSPGFQQRLALARTYLRKSPIVLLDEPVTALDEEGSNAFYKAIEYFKGHATIFIVTHRPSHLKLADQILVLNRGQMILSGTSDQLISKIPKELI